MGYDPEKPVLRRLDLRLDCDDRVGLLGANGNGKSTLAKLLCGKLDAAFRCLAAPRKSSNTAISPSIRWTSCVPNFRPTTISPS